MTRVCWTCGARTDDDRRVRCDCGEPLWLATDPDAAPDSWPDAVESMWDVLPLLGVDESQWLSSASEGLRPSGRGNRRFPGDRKRSVSGHNRKPAASGDNQNASRSGDVDAPTPPAGLPAAAGGTPLLRTESLDTDGVAVHVKHEGLNPTGSFKDRGTAFGVAAALARGEGRIGTVSHGNMAESVAAGATAAGMDCTVLVPADIADERLAAIARYDPRLVRVDGDYGRLYDESFDIGREAGVRFLNSDVPWRVAGQATTALEVLAQFARDGDVPDALVLPVSSGGHASGAWQALRSLTTGGLLDSPPKLCFVQAAACAPIAEAFARGDDAVTAVGGGETVAYSIANADPPSGTRALAAARATGGAVVAVDDAAIERAGERFADAGLAVEPASATTLAALPRLREQGVLDMDDTVALIATGRGFGAGGAAVDAETVALRELGTLFDAPRSADCL